MSYRSYIVGGPRRPKGSGAHERCSSIAKAWIAISLEVSSLTLTQPPHVILGALSGSVEEYDISLTP